MVFILRAWVAAQHRLGAYHCWIAKRSWVSDGCVVTKPFDFEGQERKMQLRRVALLRATSIRSLPSLTSAVLQVVERGTSLRDAFRVADNVYGRRSRASPT